MPHRCANRAVVLLLSLAASGAPAADPPAADPPAAEVFEKRLMPIFKSPNPSSCVQCHLTGVELRDYLLPGHEETFRSLRDQGLIDLDSPEKSRILRLIRRGEGDGGAALIHARTRRAEYDAFAAWIRACCADPVLRRSPPLGKGKAGPALPAEVIRHGRRDRLLESFERNVWSMRFRCMNCHTEGTPQNDKLRAEHGGRVAWFRKAGAGATMDHLLAGKLIDFDDPEKSLLLRKPLGAVKHGGGVKFKAGDQGYKGFRAWLEDVAAVRGNRYARAADLPPKEGGPRRYGTDLWLKLEKTPPAWGDRLVQVDVYAWDETTGAWEREPVATSDRVVWGKGRLWQHNLTLLAAPGSARDAAWTKGPPSLPPGRYLVRVHVDGGGKLERDWKANLAGEDYAGEAEFRAGWREGYGSMTVLDAGRVRR